MSLRKLTIGGVTLPNNVLLAPMAGVTDKFYRGICAQMGCGLTYTEMVSAKSLEFNNLGSKALLEIDPKEKQVAAQIFGSEPDILARIAREISETDIDIIDINMGCPVNKIVKNNEGSALMKTPRKIGEIVEKAVRASKKPVTIKIRKGFDENSVNACEVAKIAEAAGAAAIAVHGRTRSQMYSGMADWDIIRQVKESVSIPVIGNGDVVDGPTAKKMLEKTGCDGIMVGRAAQGNPWIFREIIHYLERGEHIEKPCFPEKKEMVLAYAFAFVEGDKLGSIIPIRKNISDFIKGCEGAAEARVQINKTRSYEELFEYLSEFAHTVKED